MNHPLLTTSWVAIDVDPDETYVFNSELRVLTDTQRKNSYKYICVTLREWLDKCQRAEQMKLGLSKSQEIIFSSSNAEPMIRTRRQVDSLFAAVADDYIFDGLWEVIVPLPVLNPEHFAYNSCSYQSAIFSRLNFHFDAKFFNQSRLNYRLFQDLERQVLIDSRHDSAENQLAYDRRFGLMPR